MKLKGIYRTLIILSILALNVSCDQATKSMMRNHINYYDHYTFLQGHVTLYNIENKGAFLGLGDSLHDPFRFILLTLLPAMALIGMLVYIILNDRFSNLALLGIIFMIGGGMGNLYDRIKQGSVTDFMHLKFGILQTGIFNTADVSIVLGVILILLDVVIRKNGFKKRHPKAA